MLFLSYINKLFMRHDWKLKYFKMSLFTQVLNPITGQSEWKSEDENYDYHQEIARAAFADMLHDTERNKKYFQGLKKTIEKMHAIGTQAHVLDIGTGTGLLSMMAVKCGADTVTACEAFGPMANCAEKIIESNGMKEKIHLIKKRSTDIQTGETGDMVRRANILVTEVFDTELIGEGAIEIFNHAHKHLLTDDCVVIPDSSTIYAQLVECPLALSWQTPKLLANLEAEVMLEIPKQISKCPGDAAVHDIQLSQLSPKCFNTIVKPFPIFQYNFSSPILISKNCSKNMKLIASSNGILQVLFFWWDIKMDQDGEIILSCAPYWSHPDFNRLSKEQKNNDIPIQNCIPWRDHWMQGIYYLPNNLMVSNGEEFYLNANQDEYSFWFDVQKSEQLKKIHRHSCNCGFHLAYPRSRIGQMNQGTRNKKYFRILEETIDKDSNILSIGEGSLLGLSIASLGAQSVTCLEKNRLSSQVLNLYIECNKLKNVNIVKDLQEIEDFKNITHIFAEPYYTTSILPWNNFYFGTLLSQIKEKLNENVKIIPCEASIMAVPVEFMDLHKIRTPLGSCEGFDLRIFDKLVDNSTKLADATVEAQPLWEYPCKALSKPEEIIKMNFKNFVEDQKSCGKINIEINGSCNGIALWVDWNLDGVKSIKSIVSTGPTEPIEVGKFINWDMYTRQGVHLIANPILINKGNVLLWDVIFKKENGDLKFKFNIT